MPSCPERRCWHHWMCICCFTGAKWRMGFFLQTYSKKWSLFKYIPQRVFFVKKKSRDIVIPINVTPLFMSAKKNHMPSVFRHHHWQNTLLAWHAYCQLQLRNITATTLFMQEKTFMCHVGFANDRNETHCVCSSIPWPCHASVPLAASKSNIK